MVAILKKIKWLTNVLETIYPDVSLCQFWWLHYTIYVVITNLLEMSFYKKKIIDWKQIAMKIRSGEYCQLLWL